MACKMPVAFVVISVIPAQSELCLHEFIPLSDPPFKPKNRREVKIDLVQLEVLSVAAVDHYFYLIFARSYYSTRMLCTSLDYNENL